MYTANEDIYKATIIKTNLRYKQLTNIYSTFVHSTEEEIENNTWVRRNTKFISSVEHDISEISCSTREINLVCPSTHVFFCLLYKLQVLQQYKMSRSYDW